MVTHAQGTASQPKEIETSTTGRWAFSNHKANQAYQLDLPSEYNVSATFNVADLSHFLADYDLRTNPFEEEENDAILYDQPRDTVEAPEGPMTRARTKRFREQLNLFVANFLTEREQSSESKPVCIQVIQALENQMATRTSN